MSKTQLTTGSRVQVWHGTAKKTSGGLTKGDLRYNQKTGRIVSAKASARAKSASNPLRRMGLLGAIGLLEAGGYVAQRGGPRRTPLPGQGKMARRARSMSPRRRKSPEHRMSHKHRMSPKRRKSPSPMAALRRSMRQMMA